MNIRMKLLGLVVLSVSCLLRSAHALVLDADLSYFIPSGTSPITITWDLPENTCGTLCGHTCQVYNKYQYSSTALSQSLTKQFINCTACASGYSLHERTIQTCLQRTPTTCYNVKVNICSVECSANTYCKATSGDVLKPNCMPILSTDGSSKTVCNCAGTCTACPSSAGHAVKSYADKNSSITDCFITATSDSYGTYITIDTDDSEGNTCHYSK